jgi:hypothetical protein
MKENLCVLQKSFMLLHVINYKPGDNMATSTNCMRLVETSFLPHHVSSFDADFVLNEA